MNNKKGGATAPLYKYHDNMNEIINNTNGSTVTILVERMNKMKECKSLYDEMKKEGFINEAEHFKKMVAYTTLLFPEKTDKEIHDQFLKTINNYK